ncbi:hypothetical protein KD146_13855 [Devosia sp. BSSL-BM10]|uniref:Uncharacterized protein n=1 Tax=Devosia litorisediminis TaxID=2829817 RepID=A0A942EEI8_9HYPH|nr:hypothetical protein [Devosia litorisediminis]MBS3849784.1 hypothetical protein [Devosia litorisediminis]
MVRSRPTSDAAYRPTRYSDLVASWENAPSPTIEVLLGLRLSIVMPEGDCDEKALEDCLGLAAIGSPIKPVEMARREVERYLTVHEKRGLEKGHPVLFHHLIDRQRVAGRGRGRPRLTDRLNRVADARQFMIAQALHHLGHLLAGEPLSGADQAFHRSGNKVIEDWWPSGLAGREAPNALYDKLLTTFSAGNHVSIYSKFLPPGIKPIRQVMEVYRDFSFADDTTEAAITYWLTVLRAGLLVEGIAQTQQSALIRLSKTDDDEAYERSDIMDFIGANGSRPSLSDLLPVAYFGVPDLGHIARWTSGLHNFYECAAAVGEIARGQRARISYWQAALLLNAFDATEYPDPTVSSGPARYLQAFAFLRAAMTQVRASNWWQSSLLSARVDNYGFRHIALSDDICASAAEFLGSKGVVAATEASPITELLIALAARAGLGPMGKLNEPDNLRLFGAIEGGGMWFDPTQHERFGGDSQMWLDDSVAQCVCQLALEKQSARSLHLGMPTSPHCFADHIAVSEATHQLLRFLTATPLPHHKIDIDVNARWLSDAETAEAKQRGQAAAQYLISKLEAGFDV